MELEIAELGVGGWDDRGWRDELKRQVANCHNILRWRYGCG
jgi:hypothetical protein